MKWITDIFTGIMYDVGMWMINKAESMWLKEARNGKDKEPKL